MDAQAVSTSRSPGYVECVTDILEKKPVWVKMVDGRILAHEEEVESWRARTITLQQLKIRLITGLPLFPGISNIRNLLVLTPHSGRTHQIRAVLSFLGTISLSLSVIPRRLSIR
jgi:hypothetical protein